ncbi:MAG: helix-turn-helix domain-containing protein [Cycloclasticus sp.]|nr:FNR-like transcriptional regulator [Cycloclasticus sp. 44_32_T64]
MTEDCNHCSLSNTCLPSAFDKSEVNKLERIVSSGKNHPRQQCIYHQGTTFQALYIVKSGALKTFITNSKSDENITGFYLPGDIVGLESISKRAYLSTAITITNTLLCKVNYQQLAELRKSTPSLSDWAINLFSQSLASGHDFFNCLSQQTAVARLATFLLVISKRTSRSDQYQANFHLSMSRQDIGNYLGLACETTSRAFTRLVEKKCIRKRNKEISIIDLTKLQQCSTLNTTETKRFV